MSELKITKLKSQPDWQRLSVVRWLSRADVCELTGHSINRVIQFIDPIAEPKAFPGCKKLTYDRRKVDAAMEHILSL